MLLACLSVSCLESTPCMSSGLLTNSPFSSKSQFTWKFQEAHPDICTLRKLWLYYCQWYSVITKLDCWFVWIRNQLKSSPLWKSVRIFPGRSNWAENHLSQNWQNCLIVVHIRRGPRKKPAACLPLFPTGEWVYTLVAAPSFANIRLGLLLCILYSYQMLNLSSTQIAIVGAFTLDH